MDLIIGGGTLAHCSSTSNCTMSSSATLKFPNGITKGNDGLYYVVSSATGIISVFSLSPETQQLTKVDDIPLGIPADNLSLDGNGDIWAAAFPDSWALIQSWMHQDWDVGSTALRIRKLSVDESCSPQQDCRGTKREYQVMKALEDGVGEVLRGSTVAAYDAKTKTLWMGGVLASFAVVCEPTNSYAK